MYSSDASSLTDIEGIGEHEGQREFTSISETKPAPLGSILFGLNTYVEEMLKLLDIHIKD